MPTGSEFSRIDLGPRDPHFQGVTDQAQGTVPDQFERFSGPENSGPFGAEGTNTFRPGMEPENLLDTQAAQVRQTVDAKRDSEEVYGLRTPVAGLGVHRFLRDGIAGYGNREPEPDANIPFSKMEER